MKKMLIKKDGCLFAGFALCYDYSKTCIRILKIKSIEISRDAAGRESAHAGVDAS